MNFFGKFDIPPKKKDIESSKEKKETGIKTKIFIALLALLGISTLAEAQQKVESLSPEEMQKLAQQVKEIMSDTTLTKSNPNAFVEQRAQRTAGNEWQELTVLNNDNIEGYTTEEIISRPTENTCISNNAGILVIKEIITAKDSSQSIKKEKGYCNYESNVIILADTNSDGLYDIGGTKWISNPEMNYDYNDLYNGTNTNNEKRELKSFRSKIGSKFRKDQVGNSNAFYEAAKKAGVIWWINTDLSPEEKGALQLNFSKDLKEMVAKAKQEKNK